MQKTALNEIHRELSAKMVPFGGWEMPVQYTGVMDEHLACRRAAALFDVSHMGEFEISGTDAETSLNQLLTNNIAKTVPGQAQYNLLCQEDGGIVDDLVLYRKSASEFLLIVNASNIEKDFAHIKKHLKGNVELRNRSSEFSLIALQGPQSEEILQKLTSAALKEIAYYRFAEGKVGGVSATIARTGYTGEDGFELCVPWEKGPEVWKGLLEAGKELDIKPAGLAARDTLRLEMRFPLYGNELSEKTNPFEAGLGWVTKLKKGPFLGSEALASAKENLTRKLVGIQMLERGVPRAGYTLVSTDGVRIGEVTSGTHSPTLKIPIAIGYVKKEFSEIETKIGVEIRGKPVAAQVVKTPFVSKK